MIQDPQNRSTLVCLFPTRESAEEAYDDLKHAGYTKGEITVVMTTGSMGGHNVEEECCKRDTEVVYKAIQSHKGISIGKLVSVFTTKIARVVIAAFAGKHLRTVKRKQPTMNIEMELDGKIQMSVLPHAGEDIELLCRKWKEQKKAEVYL